MVKVHSDKKGQYRTVEWSMSDLLKYYKTVDDFKSGLLQWEHVPNVAA